MFDWLEQRLRSAHELTDAMNGVNFVDALRAPATVDAIERCEAALELFLPDSYRQFLALHDGGFLGVEVAMTSTTSTNGIQIFSAGECAEATRNLADDLSPFELPIGALDGLIVFAEYSNSDRCLFAGNHFGMSEYPVLDGFHEAPDEWRQAVIAPTFEEWLRNVFVALIDRREYPQYWIPTPLQRR